MSFRYSLLRTICTSMISTSARRLYALNQKVTWIYELQASLRIEIVLIESKKKERTLSHISRSERSLASSSGLLQNKFWKPAAFCCFKANWQLHSTDGRRNWCGKVLQGQALKENGMWALVYINVFRSFHFFFAVCHVGLMFRTRGLSSFVVFVFSRAWVDGECSVAEEQALLKLLSPQQ